MRIAPRSVSAYARSARHGTRDGRASFKARVSIFCAVLLGLALSYSQARQARAANVFEIELPEARIASTSDMELVIPSAHVATILVHVLNPQAALIDYGKIFTSINGQATATISDMRPSERGKLVRIDLKKRDGLALVPGRNTVEIRAENRLGAVFYSSFILRTETENRNPAFQYRSSLGNDPSHQTPPDLRMTEPKIAIEMPSTQNSMDVRFSGVAAAVTSVERILIDGAAAPLKRVPEGERKIGLAHEENRVMFDLTRPVRADASNVAIEVVDSFGNRITELIPIHSRAHPASQFKGKKYALIIGISKFLNNGRGVKDLQYAHSDAASISEFLQSPAAGAFPSDNIKLLLNENATLAAVREALTTFIAKPGPDDLLLIFIATHGMPDPLNQQNHYFVMYDTDLERMSDTALAMSKLGTLVEQRSFARRRVMLFDTCDSAGISVPAGVTARGGNNLSNLILKRLYLEEGTATMTSSDVGESSYEHMRWGGGHGVFTHFLLEGLKGKADENLDGLVTVGELFGYVNLQVVDATSQLYPQASQHPQMVPGGNADLTLAAVNRPTSGL
ncbi:MAG: hypothetical protein DMF61_15460 [Blastocatellia bacterium AA13]|nr:MAG: hypothetical protein DMF61_15460 [Blastocatellia bacterium AA13]